MRYEDEAGGDQAMAMNCMASRIPAGPEDYGDVADIAVLIRHLGLGDADQAFSIVARYDPEEQILFESATSSSVRTL